MPSLVLLRGARGVKQARDSSHFSLAEGPRADAPLASAACVQSPPAAPRKIWYRCGVRVLGSLLVGLALLGGCTQPPTSALFCPGPPSLCDCQDSRDRGAVVVRWRIADASIGKLLDRGQCCCNPSTMPSETEQQQCMNNGGNCVMSPAWLVRNVQLHIKSVSTDPPTLSTPVDCTIIAPCEDAELTTQSCLEEGVYDLQLTADIEVVPKEGGQFVCSHTETVSPPVVRRTVKPGQTVNLDGVVLGINPPSVAMPDAGPSGGVGDAGAVDGGTTD